MKRVLLAALSAGLAVSGAFAGAATAGASAASPNAHARLHAKRICADVAPGYAHCMSFVQVTDRGVPFVTQAPAGYGPADLQDAYNLPSDSKGDGQTVAIVDAFDNPNAEADLGVYRSTFGLPACTTKNGCFRKVDQKGGTDYPVGNTGWGTEIALDIDMVSAICPNCHILLVEAKDNTFKNLGVAVARAAKMGADAISNSYGGHEGRGELKIEEKYFDHPGIAVTASSGDSGYGNSSPAGMHVVTAVGGTTLTRSGNSRGWNETAWSGAGSGCSHFEPKPAWQTDVGCKRRAMADVSAVGNPSTGVAVYDTYGFGGWLVFGGTSVSSPIIASVYALAGDDVTYAERVYQNPKKLYDITSGSNGTCSSKWQYLCNAGKGYDGPTGLGTPNGIGDF